MFSPKLKKSTIFKMKKITRIFTVLAVVSVAAFTQAKAQVDIGVNLQLHRPVAYERNERIHPNRPSAAHVWVAEEWRWNPGRRNYEYVAGHWGLPPRHGGMWMAGHWEKRKFRRGFYWVPGHWR
ncbi:YXWGXW repeat-containing protein [Mucilaginibacter gotjawali]|uniref:Uncharacterized protein n=2 Tax=Mucilaginibacter gotjawali TaxID=1550579 RepID=A0A0X8X5I9_9SPHI|nr:YXWGXW repeat-containing protein [Mucilaginibacter gotjawali]MBB3056934.1 hypothetical protein [Mucilaginibacter gotjawali]BAU56014.1 hypothetical protein MgSA37_04206 [Mucilaginibacter gotjawali]